MIKIIFILLLYDLILEILDYMLYTIYNTGFY